MSRLYDASGLSGSLNRHISLTINFSPGDGMIDLWELQRVLGAAAMMWELLRLKISALLIKIFTSK